MKYFICFISFLFYSHCFAQETVVKIEFYSQDSTKAFYTNEFLNVKKLPVSIQNKSLIDTIFTENNLIEFQSSKETTLLKILYPHISETDSLLIEHNNQDTILWKIDAENFNKNFSYYLHKNQAEANQIIEKQINKNRQKRHLPWWLFLIFFGIFVIIYFIRSLFKKRQTENQTSKIHSVIRSRELTELKKRKVQNPTFEIPSVMLYRELTDEEKNRQDFEPENFKEYVHSLNINETQHCSTYLCRKAKETKSWISTQPSLHDNFTRLGSLIDKKIISNLSYMQAHDENAQYWNNKAIIATGFYPYNSSEVFQCNACGNLFSVYTETGGHGPDNRMRWIQKDLIYDTFSNAYFLLKDDELEGFAKDLGISIDEFNVQYQQKKPKHYSILESEKVLLYNYESQFKSEKYHYIGVCTDRKKHHELTNKYNYRTRYKEYSDELRNYYSNLRK